MVLHFIWNTIWVTVNVCSEPNHDQLPQSYTECALRTGCLAYWAIQASCECVCLFILLQKPNFNTLWPCDKISASFLVTYYFTRESKQLRAPFMFIDLNLFFLSSRKWLPPLPLVNVWLFSIKVPSRPLVIYKRPPLTLPNHNLITSEAWVAHIWTPTVHVSTPQLEQFTLI